MKFILAITLALLFVAESANAAPCKNGGMDVLRANDGSGFVFYMYRKSKDVAFTMPGNEISFPSGMNGPKRFFVDGILFEITLVSKGEFIDSKRKLSDEEILEAHMAYEQKYVLDSVASPLKQFRESGINVRRATDDQPEFSFNLWQAIDPDNPIGPSQYYVSTVTSGDVIVLSAIVRNSSEHENVISALHQYTDTFQHILRKDQCPSPAIGPQQAR